MIIWWDTIEIPVKILLLTRYLCSTENCTEIIASMLSYHMPDLNFVMLINEYNIIDHWVKFIC